MSYTIDDYVVYDCKYFKELSDFFQSQTLSYRGGRRLFGSDHQTVDCHFKTASLDIAKFFKFLFASFWHILVEYVDQKAAACNN